MEVHKDLEKLILIYSLENAVKYDSIPDLGAVMGKIMAKDPELRKDAKEVSKIAKDTIDKVSMMGKEERERELKDLLKNFDFGGEERKKEKEMKLPDLDVKEGEKVVIRLAPNPNGPPTLGHARGIVSNGEYANVYDGEFILRFDDTDPRIKRPLLSAYEWYIRDCEWLGYKPDRIVTASGRMPIYYDYAEELIRLGKGYVCFCDRESFKVLKDRGEACPHRDQSVEDNLDYWNRMLSGEYREGEAVLRIKTDMKGENPALRDFVVFRIIYKEHPKVGKKYCVWPMLDFESAVEDHLLGVTHIIRGKDLMDGERKQRFIYRYFDWIYPKTIYWGRMKIHEFGKFSKSSIKKGIDEGIYDGWDDPRLPTILAMRKRGISPEAIRNFMIKLGVGNSDISISMKNIYAENRKIIDPKVNRYFFVCDPIELEVKGAEERTARVPLHPNFPERGVRELKVKDRILIARKDYERFSRKGSTVRLKNLYNIEIKGDRAFYAGERIEDIPIIHWLPDGFSKKMKVIAPERVYEGVGEEGMKSGEVVQLERFGYCRIDSVNDEIIAYFAHK